MDSAMIKKPHSAIGLPTKLLKGILPELPRHAEGHDERLLDEALAETFPASDSSAATPIHSLRGSSSCKLREIEWPSKVSDAISVKRKGQMPRPWRPQLSAIIVTPRFPRPSH